MSAPPALRTHEIRPPSARAETWMVARAAFHIVYWSALVVSAETHDPARPLAGATAPSPFERRLGDLSPDDQRLYRALREGAVEAERRRSTSGRVGGDPQTPGPAGRWPSASDLAREGIPPFAIDPIDRARYAWSSVQTGTAVNYIGTPEPSSKRATFVLIITEPDPGTAIDPSAKVDDVHHRLADGSMIHVTVWMGPALAPNGRAVAVLPPDQGYQQILGAL